MVRDLRRDVGCFPNAFRWCLFCCFLMRKKKKKTMKGSLWGAICGVSHCEMVWAENTVLAEVLLFGLHQRDVGKQRMQSSDLSSKHLRSSRVSCNLVLSSIVSTLPETNSSPLKMDGWKTSFLLGWSIFRGYVSSRGCNHDDIPIITCNHRSIAQ